MRTYALAFAVVVASSLAGLAPADEAADRAAKLLAGYTEVRAELLGTQRLGLFVEGKLVGYLAFTLARDDTAGSKGYRTTMTAEMRLGAARLVRSFQGRCLEGGTEVHRH